MRWKRPIHSAAAGSRFGDELLLKMLMVAVFLPEGLSFFIGDFRLSPARAVLIVLCIAVTVRAVSGAQAPGFARVPSDVIALIAGIWMILATAVTDGFVAGFKGGAAAALEFTGAYYVFRYLLGPVDSSVRVVRFSCKLIIPIVVVALLDPLTGRLFTYEIIKGLTGYVKVAYEGALVAQAQTIFRDGLVRAMGPLEHSILFGAVCVWLGALALVTFPSRLFGWSVAAIALIGVWFSQARAPLVGYVLACALGLYYIVTKRFTARWKVLGLLAAIGIIIVFAGSGSPIATLMRLALLSPEAAWYRQAIWQAGVPVVMNSPVFGIGMMADWGWESNGALVGGSVDAFWLANAMVFGVPGALLIFLTVAGAFWPGPIDRSHYLSLQEKRLSVALGIVMCTAVFLGFMVHFWGACLILIAALAGMRAHLAEAAILRQHAARIYGKFGG
jgi:O-Antigen ligase